MTTKKDLIKEYGDVISLDEIPNISIQRHFGQYQFVSPVINGARLINSRLHEINGRRAAIYTINNLEIIFTNLLGNGRLHGYVISIDGRAID